MENHAENVQQKVIPDPFLILVNNPKQPLHAKNWKDGKEGEKIQKFEYLENERAF